MKTGIRKAAVLGAGVMGSGIAAHLASCGIRTVLLDIVPFDLDDSEKDDPKARNRFSQGGLDKALKSRPAAFLHKKAAKLIEVGNFDDDMDKIEDCDWIVEVVKEDMGIKRSLLAKVEAHWTPGTLVTTNTSGLSIAGMLEGRSDAFKQHFFGTHFFNPVRYMHLLEIIPGPDTKPAAIDVMTTFVRQQLGKGVVFAKDTPNFIANRIGVYAMMRTLHAQQAMDMSFEEVDKIVGKPMGRKGAPFATADLVGLDTFVHVANNCYDSLTEDPERDVFKVPEYVLKMVEKGFLGRKAKAGFFKKKGKQFFTIVPETLEYRDKQKVDLPVLKKAKKVEDLTKRIKLLIEDDGKVGEMAWHVLSGTLAYAANIATDIADDVANIDRGMKWGFNWEQGPFETWQALGPKAIADRLRADGFSLPGWVDEAIAKGGFYPGDDQQYVPTSGVGAVPKIPGSLSLAKLKDAGKLVEKNRGASLIDLGDGIACLEYHTKMNSLDKDMADMIDRACDIVEADFDGLVLANEADQFSVGANLMLVVMMANQKKFDEIEEFVDGVQQLMQKLRYLSKPVVSNPQGLALGGGCEMAMAADRMMVSQETYMGLVEVGVGLVPGAGGHMNLLKRLLSNIPKGYQGDRMPYIQRAFENIAMAKVATGAGEVFELGFGTPSDEIAINRDTRINDAKTLCRYLADRGYTAPRPSDNLVLPGPSGKAAINLFVYGMRLGGFVSEHDELIADKVATILTGGSYGDGKTALDEQILLDLEREAFCSLVGEDKTIARMQHMLMKNKPLRN